MVFGFALQETKTFLLLLGCITHENNRPNRSLELRSSFPFAFTDYSRAQISLQVKGNTFAYLSNSFNLFKMNYSITRFTGIDYSNKSARWDLVAERHTQESALATCKSLNLNRPFYHRVEVNSKRVELPRFTVLKPNMKSNYEPIEIPASFTVRKKYNFFQKFIRRFF